MTEVELCNIVKKSNLFPGFTLHEEVGMDINGNSCDLVYENGDQVFCIEAKLHSISKFSRRRAVGGNWRRHRLLQSLRRR